MNLKEKKGGKRQVTEPKILFITLFMSLFALFIYRKKSINRWLGKKKKVMNCTYWTNQKYSSLYTFTQQVSQHFHKTFIYSCNWSQFHILLFLFWFIRNWYLNNCENLLCHYNNINVRLHQYLKEKKKTQTDYLKK